jgi:tetratricopeptide (TPR) repeat protein
LKLPALTVAIVLLGGPAVAVADKLDDAYQGLQEAVAKKDVAQVKKLAAEAAPLVGDALATPAPGSADEKAGWTARMDYVKSVGEYAEYALYAVSVGATPATVVDLISTLEQQNPKSKYLEGAYAPYLVALNQAGSAAKIPAIAEKALASLPNNVDLLAVLADTALTKQQNDRALSFANRVIAAFAKPKPEVVPDAEWTRKKTVLLGRAYWIAGMVAGAKNDFKGANQNLRAALPLIQGNNAMLGPALFQLGLANYQLGKLFLNKAQVLEAVKFSEQCSAIPGALADQARHNAIVMKTDADRMR